MYTGLTAKLSVGGKDIAYISNWSVEETRDTVQVTKLGSKLKETYPTTYGWSASAAGAADFATLSGQAELRRAMLEGREVEVKFYLSETDRLDGKALVNSFSVDISAEDKGNVSISLTGCGELSLSAEAQIPAPDPEAMNI